MNFLLLLVPIIILYIGVIGLNPAQIESSFRPLLNKALVMHFYQVRDSDDLSMSHPSLGEEENGPSTCETCTAIKSAESDLGENMWDVKNTS